MIIFKIELLSGKQFFTSNKLKIQLKTIKILHLEHIIYFTIQNLKK